MKFGRIVRKKGILILTNAVKFAFNVVFAYVYQMIFGPENTLAGVAVNIGFTTLPDMDVGILPLPMCGIIIVLYTLAGIVSQFAYAPIGVAFIVYFLFVVVILLLSSEPIAMKTSISFLLCFVFCQANPVSAERLPIRLLSLFIGGVLVSLWLLFRWKHHGIGKNGRTLMEQIRFCAKRPGYIFRCALGISTAMVIGMAFGLKRPMWISIVVMSLTQVTFEDTKMRIKYRSMATVLGVAVFSGIMVRFIPPQYAMVFILSIGYLSFFTSQYKYTQIVNAICALNASLFLLDAQTAVVERITWLAVGIVLVLAVWGIEYIIKRFNKTLQVVETLKSRRKNCVDT